MKLEFVLNVAKGLPKTTVAMTQVARAEVSQDVMRSKGIDDYSTPFDRLMDAFDTFIKEFLKGKMETGKIENYDFSKPLDLTLYLLWQIRNIRTHSGGLIVEGEKAKDRYEKQYKVGMENGVIPMIDIPSILEPDHEINFDFEDYKRIKNEIVFSYIAERIPKSDLEILQARSNVTNIKTSKAMIRIRIENVGIVEVDLVDLYVHGIEVDFQRRTLLSKSTISLNPAMNKLIMSTGETIPVRIIQFFSK